MRKFKFINIDLRTVPHWNKLPTELIDILIKFIEKIRFSHYEANTVNAFINRIATNFEFFLLINRISLL